MMNNSNMTTAIKCLLLSTLLLLTACDGGIFGTGGGPDMIPPNETDGAFTDSGTSPSVSESGDDAATDGASTSGSATSGATTDGTATDGSTTDPSEQDSTAGVGSPSDTEIEFDNQSAVLSTPEARLSVVNASNTTINVFESSVDPDSVLFDATGLAPLSQSNSVILTNNETSLDIVNNNNLVEQLGAFTRFDVAGGSLSTVFVRQTDSTFFLSAAATQIATSDPGLIKVRVVQGSELGDASATAQFSLLSSVNNSGGMDASFGQVSFFTPPTPYLEIPAGDYEFVDELNRKDIENFSFIGGRVYTITIIGTGATPSLLSDDTALAN